jgi:hypothetical protein
VQSLLECELDGKPAVEIRCRGSEGGPITYYFDSKNHWVCRGWQSRRGGYRVIYGPVQNGVAPPTRVEVSGFQPDGTQIVEDLYEFSEFTTAHPDPSEFTLARFGLSEKPLPAEPKFGKDFGFHIVLVGAGLLLAGFVIVIYVFARWKPAKSA